MDAGTGSPAEAAAYRLLARADAPHASVIAYYIFHRRTRVDFVRQGAIKHAMDSEVTKLPFQRCEYAMVAGVWWRHPMVFLM